MNDVLLVSSPSKAKDALLHLLNEAHIVPREADDCVCARRFIKEGETALVIVNAPVGTDSGMELCVEVAKNTTCAVLLLVRAEDGSPRVERAEKCGILTLRKPLASALFREALRFSFAFHQRMLWLKNENVSLQDKIEEIRLINRAKCTLIQYLGLSEPQAHRYIEKQAMDRRIPSVEVARSILKAYET